MSRESSSTNKPTKGTNMHVYLDIETIPATMTEAEADELSGPVPSDTP